MLEIDASQSPGCDIAWRIQSHLTSRNAIPHHGDCTSAKTPGSPTTSRRRLSTLIGRCTRVLAGFLTCKMHDARKAGDLGFEGIVVSNHAGRQADSTMASLDALESIAQKVEVTYDSGRLIMGEEGIRHVLAFWPIWTS